MGIRAYVKKPIVIRDIADTVREVLNHQKNLKPLMIFNRAGEAAEGDTGRGHMSPYYNERK